MYDSTAEYYARRQNKLAAATCCSSTTRTRKMRKTAADMNDPSNHHHEEDTPPPPPPPPPLLLSLFGDDYTENNDEMTRTDHLSYKLNELSMEERSNALYDLHGVGAEPIKETTEIVAVKTKEMTTALDDIVAGAAARSSTSSTSTSTSSCRGVTTTATCAAAQEEEEEDSRSSRSSSSTTTTTTTITSTLAYRIALEKSPEYVESLKMLFLRADAFDSQAAAGRMIQFFHEKMKHFGEKKLVQDIRMEDLSEDGIDALKRGLFQILRQRDRARRGVLFGNGLLSGDYSLETQCRVLFYLIFCLLDEIETQKNGIVCIYYGVGQNFNVEGSSLQYMSILRSAPVRVIGVHRCHDSPILTLSKKRIIGLLESKSLVRFRFHMGSHMECIYNLMTFGIPREAIPIKNDGTMDLTNHNKILDILNCREQIKDQTTRGEKNRTNCVEECLPARCVSPSLSTTSSSTKTSVKDCCEQRQQEQSCSTASSTTTTSTVVDDVDDHTSSTNIILVPGPMDILLGRGRQQQYLPGMVRFNNLLEQYWDIYEDSSKLDKTGITMAIFTLLKQSNCRFLITLPDGGGYMECDDETGREKIAHSFRSLRRRKKKLLQESGAATTTTSSSSSSTKAVSSSSTTTAATAKRQFSDFDNSNNKNNSNAIEYNNLDNVSGEEEFWDLSNIF